MFPYYFLFVCYNECFSELLSSHTGLSMFVILPNEMGWKWNSESRLLDNNVHSISHVGWQWTFIIFQHIVINSSDTLIKTSFVHTMIETLFYPGPYNVVKTIKNSKLSFRISQFIHHVLHNENLPCVCMYSKASTPALYN